jgi:hypothetical protein
MEEKNAKYDFAEPVAQLVTRGVPAIEHLHHHEAACKCALHYNMFAAQITTYESEAGSSG